MGELAFHAHGEPWRHVAGSGHFNDLAHAFPSIRCGEQREGGITSIVVAGGAARVNQRSDVACEHHLAARHERQGQGEDETQDVHGF